MSPGGSSPRRLIRRKRPHRWPATNGSPNKSSARSPSSPDMPDYPRIYARQEYMTPGAAETVEIIADTVQPTEATWLLDIASGKGEAASTLAGRYGCRIACIEPFDAFVHIATSKFW